MAKKESSLLGIEDVPWLWQEIPKLVSEFDLKVYSIRCEPGGVIVKFMWNGMDEFELSHPVFNVLIQRSKDMVTHLCMYVNAQWNIRKARLADNRRAAVLRLSDYDGHYMYG